MKSYIDKIRSIFPKSKSKSFFNILLLNLINTFMEVFNIAMVIPLFTIILEKTDLLEKYNLIPILVSKKMFVFIKFYKIFEPLFLKNNSKFYLRLRSYSELNFHAELSVLSEKISFFKFLFLFCFEIILLPIRFILSFRLFLYDL